MILKKHSTTEGQLILAMCDEELLGKEFEENELILDLTSEFYKGKKLSEEEAEKLINDAYIINAVGEKVIEFLKKKEYVDKVKEIQKIPYTQIVLVKE